MKKTKYLAFAFVLALVAWPHLRAGAASRCYPTERFRVLDGQWVRDTLTRLVWQRQVKDTMTWSSAQAYCSSTGFRLPTIKELRSIVDFTVAYPGPVIDQKAFPDTPATLFWTSSLKRGVPGWVWYLDFRYGTLNYTGDENRLRVRCVR